MNVMNTEKLCYQNAYIQTCPAIVQDCVVIKDHYGIVLDRTCFYPEGGGQPGDTGMLSDVRVFDTHEKDGQILHYTREALQPGTEVQAAIDWDRRFDLMQQHSGEHMLSGYIHGRWGYENVGFHMGADRITIDLSGELTWEELMEAEVAVNERIWKNEPVKVWYPSSEELGEIPYRSKNELTGDVRIVEIAGTDICACCGTHVAGTGEIGLLKILNCEKFHEGIRVEMVCGRRAMAHLGQIFEQNRRVSQLLSAKPAETAQAVADLAADQGEKRRRIYELEERLFAVRAEEMDGRGDVLAFYEELESDGIRRACDALQKRCGGRAAVCAGTDEAGYKYAVGFPGGDLRSLVREINETLHGRGGGKPFFVQGSVQACAEEIRAFFAARGFDCGTP